MSEVRTWTYKSNRPLLPARVQELRALIEENGWSEDSKVLLRARETEGRTYAALFGIGC